VAGAPEQRTAEWRRRLQAVDADRYPAHNLYVGEHWRAAWDAYELTLKFSSRTELWVISAGYGLISAARRVKSYSATFSSGSLDSVWRGSDEGERRVRLRDWWAGLPHEAALAELLGRDNVVLLAAGATYVDALDADLCKTARADGTRERFSLVSAGSQSDDTALPVDGRLRGALGGTDNGLNARVLTFLAATAHEHRFRHSKMAALLLKLAETSPPTERSVGRVSSDEQIVRHIGEMRRRDPTISRTRALTALRDAGIACEQSRFKAVWERGVVATDHQRQRAV
jgi:hypothetical protein